MEDKQYRQLEAESTGHQKLPQTLKVLRLAVPVLFLIFISWWTSSSWLEIVANFAGLWCVYLVARENLWNFPIGIVNIVGYFVMFYQSKLYADMSLQVFFLVLTLWGWWVWIAKRGPQTHVKPTSRLRRREGVAISITTVVGTVLWGYIVARLGDPVPYLDAFIAVVSILAQYLLSKKVLENWLLWIVVDVLSIGMYIDKALYLTAGQYLVLLVICVVGWVGWTREMRGTEEVIAA